MITESKNKRSTAIDSPDEANNLDTEYGEYYCTTGWHLSRVSKRGATLAGYIYELAIRITDSEPEPRIFWASLEKIADQFRVNRKTIYHAVKILVEVGLFVPYIEAGYMESASYIVLTHKQWADAHPGKCIERIEFDYSKGDPLGRKLYQASGGHIKYTEHKLKALRNTGLDDSELLEQFRLFMKNLDRSERLKWNDVGFSFLQSLKGS